MAVQIIDLRDQGMQVDSNGTTTFTREIQLEGDTLMEIGTSPLLPQKGARHPENVVFYLDSVQLTPNGNRNRKAQVLATLTYNNSIENANISITSETDPWELGAQNLVSSTQTVAKPLLSGLNKAGETIQNLNSAGCRIVAETTETVRVIGFTYCVRYKDKDAPLNDNAIINMTAERVAGIDIPAYQGKLLPMTASYIVEYRENSDRVRRRYWNISAEIHIKKSGWSLKELNVGTMAFFKDKDGAVVRKPRNIYRYTPWASWDPSVNLGKSPEFGSLEDVIAAKNYYAVAVMVHKTQNPAWTMAGETDVNNLSFYNQAWNDLPFEEVTEPMPLRADGTLYMEAIIDPVNNPYLEIDIYDADIGSWDGYNIPRERS